MKARNSLKKIGRDRDSNVKKRRDSGIKRKKQAGRRDLRTPLWTLDLQNLICLLFIQAQAGSGIWVPAAQVNFFLPKSQQDLKEEPHQKEDNPYEGVISRINPDTFQRQISSLRYTSFLERLMCNTIKNGTGLLFLCSYIFQGQQFLAGLVKKYRSPEFSVLKCLYLSCRCIGKGLHK